MNSMMQAIPFEAPMIFAGAGLGFARAMQHTLVPPVAYRAANLEAYGQTVPKEDVGGDLMDLVAAGDEVIAYVADVSGHGLPAGVLMGMVKTAVRYGLHLGQTLPVLVDAMNRVLPGVKEPHMYATFAGLRFDGSGMAEFITAGHLPLLHYRCRHRDVLRRAIDQLPVGLVEDAGYVSRRVPYEAGDVFALVTDGIVEAEDLAEMQFGLDRLEEILCEYANYPLSRISDAALAAVGSHGIQHDDRTLLLVRALK